MILYRPVGQAEYDLIAQSGFTAYPPRLPEQLLTNIPEIALFLQLITKGNQLQFILYQ